jgi:hypothetical protein
MILYYRKVESDTSIDTYIMTMRIKKEEERQYEVQGQLMTHVLVMLQ